MIELYFIDPFLQGHLDLADDPAIQTADTDHGPVAKEIGGGLYRNGGHFFVKGIGPVLQ